jgi:hypothetical protein
MTKMMLDEEDFAENLFEKLRALGMGFLLNEEMSLNMRDGVRFEHGFLFKGKSDVDVTIQTPVVIDALRVFTSNNIIPESMSRSYQGLDANVNMNLRFEYLLDEITQKIKRFLKMSIPAKNVHEIATKRFHVFVDRKDSWGFSTLKVLVVIK